MARISERQTAAAVQHTHAEADVTSLVVDLAAKEATAHKGAANGYAGLDVNGRVAQPPKAHDHSAAGDPGGLLTLASLPQSVIDAIMPWAIDVDVFMTPASSSNWSTLQQNTGYLYNYRRASSGAQNAEVVFDVVLAAGTWNIELAYDVNTNAGIITVQLDGVTVGTIDSYAAAAANNLLSSVSAAVATTGKKQLKLLMATKNASSTSYFGLLHRVKLHRTA